MAWRFWSGRRDRLALAVMGALIIGVGLSVIALLSESVMGTVVEVYSESWRAPYDILVYARQPSDEPLPHLIPPNEITNLAPGIRPEQVEAIRAIPGVAVAAPLAVVGQIELGPGKLFPRYDPEGPVSPPRRWPPGVYRVTETVSSERAGLRETFSRSTWVAASDNGALPEWVPEGLVDYYDPDTPPGWNSLTPASAVAPAPVLMVGIDPDAEAGLLGMDQAVTEGRYLLTNEEVRVMESAVRGRVGPDDTGAPVRTWTEFEIPVLVNVRALNGVRAELVVEPMGPDFEPVGVVFRVVHEGLDIIRASLGTKYSYGEFWRKGYKAWRQLLGRAAFLQYEAVASPFPGRWPRAVRLRSLDAKPLIDAWDSARIVEPYNLDEPGVDPRMRDRRTATFGRIFRSFQLPHRFDAIVIPQIVGYFDPFRLAVSKDEEGRPLETYRPAEAELVLDPQGRPVNPPHKVYGGLTPTDFLSSPPVFLTTLDAALAIVGEDGINAVRVKIEDDELITPETIARAKRIAREIEERTGLVARVTMGAAPARVLIEVPESNGHPALGWVEDVWVDLSGAVTAVEQAEFGHGAFVVVALVVGLLYAVTTALAGVTARRRELGVAAAVGWPGRALARVAVGEQALLGVAVGLMAALASALGHAPGSMVAVALVAGPVLYLPAMAAAGRAVRGVSPGEALRWGDVAPGRRVLPGSGVLPLAVASLFGRPGRTLMTVVAIALPTALLLLLSHIALRLRGVLYTSITGEYAALKVGPIQYAIGLVALAVAGVTAFDLIRQNAVDHRQERALLHALGWPRARVGLLMVAEGAVLGLLAGVLGDLLGVGVVGLLYGAGVMAAWRTAAWVWLVPVGLGALTGLLSAMVELRSWGWQALAGVEAWQVLRGGRALRWASLAVALAALGTVLVLTVPRAIEGWRSRAPRLDTSPRLDISGPEAAVAQAVIAALDKQARAVEEGNAEKFLDPVDPEASTYRQMKRHWFEDFQVWKQVHPNGRVTFEPVDVRLLGEQTAHVRVRVGVVDPDDPRASQRYVVETVWVRRGDRWYEHGLNLTALEEDGVTVWYEESIPEEPVRATAGRLAGLAERMERELGLTLSEPLILEWQADPDYLRTLLGPSLATKRGIPPWVEYGEPLRIAGTNEPSEALLAYLLGQKAAMDTSDNHASEWLREGVGRYVADRLTGRDLAVLVSSLREAGGPLRLPELPRYQNGLDLPPEQWNRVADTAALLMAYLEEEHGRGTIGTVLRRMTEAPGASRVPPDLRMTGPATFEARSRATIEAIEEVTGKSWAELDQAFQRWLSTLP